jgi:NADH dehydrogenase FAD-containing subunit
LDKADANLGSEIPYDFLVVATGSTYAFPARPPDGAASIKEVEEALRSFQADVKAATSILVVGGGAVGVEFAGEGASACSWSSDRANDGAQSNRCIPTRR